MKYAFNQKAKKHLYNQQYFTRFTLVIAFSRQNVPHPSQLRVVSCGGQRGTGKTLVDNDETKITRVIFHGIPSLQNHEAVPVDTLRNPEGEFVWRDLVTKHSCSVWCL